MWSIVLVCSLGSLTEQQPDVGHPSSETPGEGYPHSLLPLGPILLELGKQAGKRKHLWLCPSMLWPFGTPGLHSEVSCFSRGRVAKPLKVWVVGVPW